MDSLDIMNIIDGIAMQLKKQGWSADEIEERLEEEAERVAQEIRDGEFD